MFSVLIIYEIYMHKLIEWFTSTKDIEALICEISDNKIDNENQ